MIPGGYGFEILKFDDDIREVARLPKDVRVVRALPNLPGVHPRCPPDWYAPGPLLQPVYLLICHRYCVRVAPGQAYTFTEIEEFLDRYRSLAEDEKKPLEPLDPFSSGHQPTEVWHMDEDGVAREYIWHPTGGWVRR